MKIKYLLTCFLFFSAALACKPAEETSSATARPKPEGLAIEQLTETDARLTWTAMTGSQGYRVYLRTETSAYHVEPLNMNNPLPAGETSYEYGGLEAGKKYSFGVQSLGKSLTEHSAIAYAPEYTMQTAYEASQHDGTHIDAPAEVTAVAERGDLKVTWKAAGDRAEGYKVYIRSQEEESFGPAVASLAAGETSYAVSGLAAGTYVAGVQAVAKPLRESSRLAESGPCRVQDPSKTPVINDVKSTYAYVMVNYTIKGLGNNPEHGLCFSKDGTPDLDDTVIWGPSLPSNKTVSQLIPNAVLEYDTDFQVCVYARSGDDVWYSTPVKVRLGEEPALPSLDWKRVSNPAGVPAGVEVYATETPLNGRPFKAWYAVADCRKDIELRMVAPSSLTTIDKLSAGFNGDCYVMINGGYFAWDSGWSSPYVIDGKRVGDGYGSSRTSDKSWTLTTPAVLGVDKEGNASAYWWSARPSKAYYYTLPQPTVPDQAKYWYESNDTQLSSFPGQDQQWEPYNAISAGPMVLYDNKVVVDHSHNGDWYTTNYELLASDIFPGYSPDRTAIGILADGRVVLFVCDGRVDESDGASLPELGLVMKSIGCVAAQNLDGGGSTGMMLGSTHLNTWEQGKGSSRKQEYRAVKTAVGFFKRR